MKKKSAMAVSLALAMTGTAASAAVMTSAAVTVYDPVGAPVGSDNTLTGSIGGGHFSLSHTVPFMGILWTAHSVTTFGPGTYTIDTVQGGVYTGITVGAGQVGGHILWNWGATADIDIVNVWDVSIAGATTSYVSTDIDGDGIPGIGIIDPVFLEGYSMNFDFTTAVPVPAAVWLFGSGLLGLVAVARRKLPDLKECGGLFDTDISLSKVIL